MQVWGRCLFVGFLPVVVLALLTSTALGATVHIRSDPPEAIAFLDGESLGPVGDGLSATRPYGSHTVWLDPPDYRFKRLMIDFDLSAADTTLSLTLERNQGMLHIASVPDGGDCTVDGRLVGRTPVNLPDLEYGKHQVLVKSGLLEGSATIDLRYPEWEETISLEACRGWVRFSVEPASVQATLTRDADPTKVESLSDYRGLTAFPSGRIRIRASARGYEEYDRSFEVVCKDSSDVQVILRGKSRAKAFARSVVPGMGRSYLEDHRAAVTDRVLIAGAFAVSGTAWLLSRRATDDYDSAVDAYRRAISPTEIESTWKTAQDRYDRAKLLRRIQKISVGAAGVFYLRGFLGALLWHPPRPGDTAQIQTPGESDPKVDSAGRLLLGVSPTGALTLQWSRSF